MGLYSNNLFSRLTRGLVSNRNVSKNNINVTVSGNSGTQINSGMFDEEYLAKLLAEQGIDVYDQMRRSDGVVKMLLTAVKNPIKSANWTVEPVDESDEEKEIAAFVEYVLFEDLVSKWGKRKTFLEFISEAMTNIEFGFSAFEIVHKMVKGHKRFGDYIGLADLGFRHQRSIKEWVLREDGSIDHVRQLVNGDLQKEAFIAGQHLLVFSNEKEGDNYEGISMLRPCYGSWWRKNNYRKFQAIGIERCSKGIPVGVMPESMAGKDDYESQMAAFQRVIDKLSSNQTNGVVIGSGFDFKDFKISHDAEKTQKAIDAEDVEMARAFIASFLVLGTSGNSGSFALGQDLSSIFLSGIQNLAYAMNEKINLQVIRPIVKAKYGERDSYPQLAVSGIADKAGTAFAEIINKLITAGAVQVSPALQRHVHNLLDLPNIDEEIAERDFSNESPNGDETLPPTNGNKKAKKNSSPSEKEIDKSMNEENQKKKLSEKSCSCGCDCSDDSLQLAEDGSKATDKVTTFIDSQSAKLAGIMRQSLAVRAGKMLSEMEALIKKGGKESVVRDAVVKITMPYDEKYQAQLGKIAADIAEGALNDVFEELNLNKKDIKFASIKKELGKLSASLRDKLVQLLLLTSGYQDVDFEKAVYFSFNENYGRVEEEKLIEEMTRAVELQLSKNTIEVAAVNVTTKIVNNVRESVFFEPEVLSEIESFVFQNPAPVSAICQSLVGRVFSKEEFETSGNVPPLHHNCKSYVTAQMVGGSNNKPLTEGGLTVTDPKILKSKTL